MSRWYAGRWRTEEGIRRHHAASIARNRRRVFGASGFLGMAPREDQARQLNSMGREYRDRQKQSRA